MKDDILINKYWEENYNHLGKIKKITELNKKQNSQNFFIFTNKGKFVFRRVLDHSKSKKIETICNILDKCKRNDVKVMEPIKNKFMLISELPSNTPLSDQISVDLRNRGFNFIGTTTIYAFMQAIGMVNDHLTDCFRYNQV